MSEYQYYEFQAIDQPLIEADTAYVRTLSSRVELSSSHATFVYNFSSLRAEPLELLARCFDVYFYLANWGTRQLAFRLPRAAVELDVLTAYEFPEALSLRKAGNFVILDLTRQNEGGDGWVEGTGWLSRLAPLRAALLEGDRRVLYLAWLVAVTTEGDPEIDGEMVEPPVPPNLQVLSAPLRTFVEFFQLDPDLVAVAAEASVTESEADLPIETLLPKLPAAERDDFLLRLARGEPGLAAALRHRLRELAPTPAPADHVPRRTLAELLAAAEDYTRHRTEREREAAERARRAELEKLAKRENAAWEQVTALIERKQSIAYDEAVALLGDLRDLARLQGRSEGFGPRVRELAARYASRSALQKRLRRAGLV